MRRMLMELLKNIGGNDEMEWKLVDTLKLTPSEKNKSIDLSKYGFDEYLLHGDIPKTENASTFKIGVDSFNAVGTAQNSNVYESEMIAHIHIINGCAMGFAAFDSGWASGSNIKALLSTPRANKSTIINISFYPFVDGNEEAIIDIYGR